MKFKVIAIIIILIIAAFTGGFLFYLNGLGAVDPGSNEEVLHIMRNQDNRDML